MSLARKKLTDALKLWALSDRREEVTLRAQTTPTAPARVAPDPAVFAPGGIGESVMRPDGTPKVKGEFDFSSDLWMEGMLWGATLRSPHPRANIWSMDIAEAEEMPGVHAVLTHEDVPGRKVYGMEIPDQPVLAWRHVRYQGEPVAIVAADHPETARRAAEKIAVEYEVLDPLVDAEEAMGEDAPKLHPSGNVLRHVHVVHGDAENAQAEVVVAGEYEIGMQDQAFLGPESGLAVPDGEGGVDLYTSTQWLHVDQNQLAESLDLPPEMVRLTLSGVGGAFGGREDLSMQIHACMLALDTGRPVKMMYNREESFFGHVHRHPCKMRYEHGATRDGKLVYVKARIVFDGGAYASSSTAVCGNGARFAVGPYECPNALIDSYVVYTDNPPCGAMRGFGAVQTCFAHESQMDKLAEALRMDPVYLRLKNAMTEGTLMPSGQKIEGPTPVAELLERIKAMPMPEEAEGGPRDLRELPGGVSNTTHGEGVQRGVGYAVGFKNIGFSEGFDDYATARVRLSMTEEGPLAEVHTAAAEVGQRLVTIQAQIARTELGVEKVSVLPADTRVGSAGSSSASRQTYMTGGAVKLACEAVRTKLFDLAGAEFGEDPGALSLEDGSLVSGGREVASLVDLLDEEGIEETVVHRHVETFPVDEYGQGDADVQFAFSAHRAVVDVDAELGLVRVVELATAQDVGKAMNPQAVEGQIEGGTAQGLGLALLEEIQVRDGKVLNASFTDYLLPTILDMPPVKVDVLELADPGAPYGLRGIGEPPNISTPPAIVAALRDATGRELPRMPVRPEQIVGMAEGRSAGRVREVRQRRRQTQPYPVEKVTGGDPANRRRMPEKITVGEVNRLSREGFVERFGGLYEHSPWVAEAAYGARPFTSLDGLHGAMARAVEAAPEGHRMALILAHPDLAGKAAMAGELTPESKREQASAGLDALSPGEYREFHRLNNAYKEKFGFPLIFAVREHTKETILAGAERRLEHSRPEEIETAQAEISKIARLRLEDLVDQD